MNNSDWISWFFYGKPFWLAPVRIFVYAFCGIGAILIGVTTRKIRYILLGIAALAFTGFSINTYHPDLQGFIQFDLLAVKIFYGVFISVLILLIIVSISFKKHN